MNFRASEPVRVVGERAGAVISGLCWTCAQSAAADMTLTPPPDPDTFHIECHEPEEGQTDCTLCGHALDRLTDG